MLELRWSRLLMALFSLLLAGCGSSSGGFVFTGTTGNPVPPDTVPTRQVVIESAVVQARAVPSTVTTLEISALSSSKETVFGPVRRAFAPRIEIAVPVSARELRVAYLDSSNRVVAVYQQPLPLGGEAVVIQDPDLLNASAFVESIAVNPTDFSLEVGEQRPVTVTALLSDGTGLDVTTQSSLQVLDGAIVSLNGATLSGLTEGSTEITARLLGLEAVASVTVVEFSVEIVIRADSLTVTEGGTLQLRAFRLQDSVETNITSSVTWESSNLAKATVSSGGLVTALAEGQVRVDAADPQTGATASVTLTIQAADPDPDPVDSVLGLMSSVDSLVPGNGYSDSATISDDGRYVAFESDSSNLVSGVATNAVFVKDRQTQALEVVSRTSLGAIAGGTRSQISGNGRYVLFQSVDGLIPEDTDSSNDAYVYDRTSSTIELVSVDIPVGGNAYINGGTITDNGRFVVFSFQAGTLLPGVAQAQVYLRDRDLDITELISVTTAGATDVGASANFEGISQDGRYVTFTSSGDMDPTFPTAATSQAYLRDRTGQTTTLISTNAANTAPSNGETVVTWMSDTGGTILLMSRANDLVTPAITNSNGYQLAYELDVATGEKTLLTVDAQGQPLQTDCIQAVMDASQSYIFFSSGDDPVFDPVNETSNVVMERLSDHTYEVMSEGAGGQAPNEYSYARPFSMTPDGQYVVFTSDATNLAVQQVSSTTSQIFAAFNPFLLP